MRTFRQIKEAFVARAKPLGAKTHNRVVVAMVGAVGSGKSTVARSLKKFTGWPVLDKNGIRVVLREKSRGFTPQNTDEIFYAVLEKILKGGGSAILDSDFADRAKRGKLERFCRRFRVRVAYVRVMCDRDVMINRLRAARYSSKRDLFKTADIALREHLRRYPWHYRWSEKDGGTWALRKLGVRFFAEIDTTDPRKWPRRLGAVAEKLKKL